MLKNLIFSLLIFLLILFQSTVLDFLAFHGQTVDFLLIVCLVLLFRRDLDRALFSAVFGGLLVDLTGLTTTIGLGGLVMLVLLLLGRKILSALPESGYMNLLTVFILSLSLHFVASLFQLRFGPWSNIVLGGILDTVGYLVLAPLLRFVFDRLYSDNYLQLDFHDRL